jgi:hypothetical protein
VEMFDGLALEAFDEAARALRRVVAYAQLTCRRGSAPTVEPEEGHAPLSFLPMLRTRSTPLTVR